MISPSAMDTLLASLPAVLGFYPDASVFFTPLTRSAADSDQTIVPFTARADLANVLADPGHFVHGATTAARDITAEEVVLVVTGSTREDKKPPAKETIAPLREGLRHHGYPQVEAVHLAGFVAGARWFSYDDPRRHGTLPDPRNSAATVQTVLNGDVIYESRAELAALFTPAPQEDRDRLASLIATVAAAVTDEESRHDLPALQARLARLDQAVTDAAHGTLPDTDEKLADLIGAFACVLMRDALLITPGKHARAAEELWLTLWKLAPEPMSDRLAAVLMTHACHRGHGALALVAADAASRSERLVTLLLCAVQQGVAFTRIKDMLHRAVSATRASFGHTH
ncbi:DUF4192 domain-containing protein [Amycolatopsis thermoflava]|uniref:DUF4192 domain-containing protein n=1 Tax=Amycolatopsis thermoflava TaxID=84480 RepID=UPI00381F5E2E